MRNLFAKLWADDCGALIATEWVFVATILVLGVITGLVAVRNAAVTELTEFANAVLALDQSYSFTGLSNCVSITAGSAGDDDVDRIPSHNVRTRVADIDDNPCD